MTAQWVFGEMVMPPTRPNLRPQLKLLLQQTQPLTILLKLIQLIQLQHESIILKTK